MLDFPLYYQLTCLYNDYAAALDAEDWAKWPDFFLEDCVYKVLPRENHERGYPLATMSFESRGMLKDRIYGATDTIFHDPYYQRHVVGAGADGRVQRRDRLAAREAVTRPIGERHPALPVGRQQR